MGIAIGFGIVGFFLVIYFASAIKLVHPFQRGIVEQLGKYKATVDPGLHVIFPFFQQMLKIDMREQVIDVPPQEVITEDNVVVSVDAVVYYEPTDPQRLVYNVANFILAVTKLAQTNLRNLIGDMDLDEALTSRESINTNLRQILDDATDKWGVRVARVEIQRIDPPPDVMSAMHEQMKAERTRRATVLQADGEKQAAIARAEGSKQSAILSAEGIRQRQILEAEGEAQAIRNVAEAEQYRQQVVAQGEADAIRSVYDAIHQGDPTPDLIAIKYLEALGQIADGRASKIYLPAELSTFLGSIGTIGDLFTGGGPEPETEPATDRIHEKVAAIAESAQEQAPPSRSGEPPASGPATGGSVAQYQQAAAPPPAQRPVPRPMPRPVPPRSRPPAGMGGVANWLQNLPQNR